MAAPVAVKVPPTATPDQSSYSFVDILILDTALNAAIHQLNRFDLANFPFDGFPVSIPATSVDAPADLVETHPGL